VPGSRMLRLYGPLAIDGSDGAGLGQRPTRGLIAYLALNRGAVPADELLEALWPNQPPSSTRRRLWKARFQAQRLIGDALVRGPHGYRLAEGEIAIDSDEVERTLQGEPDLDRLERALALSGGEPLANIDYPWADNERRRLQALRSDTVARVGAARLASGDPHGALRAAERMIALEPLNERGWRLAMRADAALGRRQAVLDRFEALGGELDRGLGLRPDAETRATYRDLLGQG
jgi:DNA-binding SARP family transcriptional activator